MKNGSFLGEKGNLLRGRIPAPAEGEEGFVRRSVKKGELGRAGVLGGGLVSTGKEDVPRSPDGGGPQYF